MIRDRVMRAAQPWLFRLEPERAHRLMIQTLAAGFYPRHRRADDPRLSQTLFGLRFPNPLGMAAGFDKNAEVPAALLKLGFGFVEVGTVTPLPQGGNPQPRVFRLPDDRAVINRLGFNNDGHEAVHARLLKRPKTGIIGVNIGANKHTRNRTEDYVSGLGAFVDVADYFTINISSPNTPGLRDLQAPVQLNALLSWIMAAREGLISGGKPWRPILVKLAPDIADDDLAETIAIIRGHQVDGIIIANTTIGREGLTAPHQAHAGEQGGLSGPPVFMRSTRMLARVYRLTEGALPLIGVGGISGPAEALAKIEAGASLIQLYTGLIYEGPGLIPAIKARLTETLDREGLASISAIVGRRAEAWAI